MLPFTKRTARSEDPSELIHTGDIEVMKSQSSKRSAGFPPPAAGRPRVFTHSASDEDMTTLLPRKGMTFGVRSAPITPVPMPKRASGSPPKPMLEEPPTRQYIKPSSPPPSISPVAGPPRSNRPPTPERAPTVNQHVRAALKPQPVPSVRPDGQKSDPRIDPPATVVTARTRIVAARPTISWAAALVAMGVFVGLVTAVVARGDADTLIDAAASFVDPSGGRAAASGSSASSVQTKAQETHGNFVSVTDTLTNVTLAAANADTKVAWDAPSATATPLPPRPAPVAYAGPVHHSHAVHAAAKEPKEAKEAKDKDDRVAVASTPKSAPAAKAAPAAKPAAKASDDDVESASAADALAKAQLEASLR